MSVCTSRHARLNLALLPEERPCDHRFGTLQAARAACAADPACGGVTRDGGSLCGFPPTRMVYQCRCAIIDGQHPSAVTWLVHRTLEGSACRAWQRKSAIAQLSAIEPTPCGIGDSGCRRAAPCAPGLRNLVLGAAYGYSASAVRLFTRTFRAAGLHRQACGVLLREDDRATERGRALEREAAACGVHTAAAGRDYAFARRVDRIGLPLGAISPGALKRYAHGFAFLVEHGRRFDRVLLVDTRDAYFQADPFAHVPADPTGAGPATGDVGASVGGTFYATTEQRRGASLTGLPPHPCCTLAHNPPNRQWLLHAGGPGIAHKLGRLHLAEYPNGELPILNSGVSIGTTRGVLSYLRAMLDEIARLGHGKRASVLDVTGVDQGIHNLVVWGGRLSNASTRLRVLSNEDGWLAFHNVCWEPKRWRLRAGISHSELKGDLAGIAASPLHATDPFLQLRNGHRTALPAIVHQYDRCAYLVRRAEAWLNDTSLA